MELGIAVSPCARGPASRRVTVRVFSFPLQFLGRMFDGVRSQVHPLALVDTTGTQSTSRPSSSDMTETAEPLTSDPEFGHNAVSSPADEWTELMGSDIQLKVRNDERFCRDTE